jgi:hypothetical protein
MEGDPNMPQPPKPGSLEALQQKIANARIAAQQKRIRDLQDEGISVPEGVSPLSVELQPEVVAPQDELILAQQRKEGALLWKVSPKLDGSSDGRQMPSTVGRYTQPIRPKKPSGTPKGAKDRKSAQFKDD